MLAHLGVMKITKQTVEDVARLAVIHLTPEQLKEYSVKFGRVIEYIEALNRLDTKDVEPTSHALDVNLRMREDEAKKFVEADSILENAPKRDGRFVQVPRVI